MRISDWSSDVCSSDLAIVARFLRQIAEAAATGLQRLDAMEEHRLRAAAVAGNILRPGKLFPLLAFLQLRPVTSPRVVARQLELSISGAGKLLARAADAGLLVEISGRQIGRASCRERVCQYV